MYDNIYIKNYEVKQIGVLMNTHGAVRWRSDMPTEVITAALSLVGALVGTLGGIALSSIKRQKKQGTSKGVPCSRLNCLVIGKR